MNNQSENSKTAVSNQHHPGKETLKSKFVLIIRTILIIFLLLIGVGIRPLQAAGVVGDGTPASCTETALRAAVSGGGVVTFNCGGSKTIILQQHTQITIYADTIIDGGGQITLSGDNATRIFYVSIIGNLTVRNITLTNGYADGYGGAVYISDGASFTAENSTIQNSQTNGWAGSAIFAEGVAEIVLQKSNVTNNRTTNYGAINSTGPVTIVDSVISGNFSDAGGGAMSVSNQVTIQNSQISNNHTENDGGALLVGATAYVVIENSLINENASGDDGGGIKSEGEMLIQNSTILSNSANDEGGGLYLSGSDAYITIENSTISNNLALDAGGGIKVRNGSELILYQSTLSYNAAVTNSGGGLYVGGSTTIARLTSTTVYGNLAESAGGGGISIISDGTATFDNVTISDNTALQGGGIENYGSTSILIYVTLYGNFSYGDMKAANFHLENGATATAQNTILGAPGNGPNCSTTGSVSFVSSGFNLSSDGSCSSFLKVGGDINNQPALLGNLANNGGLTLTHMPLANSPAIDGGKCLGGGLVVDQRNAPRPAGNACDIGAVEFGAMAWHLYLPFVIK